MNFLKKNWRLCFGCYIFIYLPWFFYLEKKITMETPNLHIINNAIDDMIPFCVYFIIPAYSTEWNVYLKRYTKVKTEDYLYQEEVEGGFLFGVGWAPYILFH